MKDEGTELAVTAPKAKRGRPPKAASLDIVLKSLPSIKEAKEDALMHLQGFIHQPWTEANTSHKLKAVQLYLQHLDSLRDEEKLVVEDSTGSLPANYQPTFETVDLSSLSEEEFKAYQRAFGDKHE